MFDIIIKEEDADEVIARVRCNTNRCTIGKGRGNLIQLKGWRIGNVHAELLQNDNGIFVEDKGTSIGTRVNNARVHHYGPLRSADTITIDVYRLFVGIVEAEQKTPEPVVESAAVSEPAEASLASATLGTEVETVAPRPAVSQPARAQEPAGEPQLKSVLAWDENDPRAVERAEKQLWRNRIHLQLLRMMDVRRTEVESMDEGALREQARQLIIEIIEHIGERLPSFIDRVQLAKEVLDEAVGLGPLEELLADEA